jgi:dipeptidyl aminopeptidase/acylaminoacyl peptidase
VQYDSPVGKLNAYLSSLPRDGKKHPAIIWITGGDCNSIGDVWSRAAKSNDQTASAYRLAGIVTMYPALRGGNGGPGKREGWLGEVDDVLAAAEFLAKQEGIDSQRVYLGGHSTGGTLVLLTAECSDRFRAVFSFGPVADVSGYGDEYLPFNTADKRELEVRSPGHWLEAIQTPTFVIEGSASGTSNILSLKAMERSPHGDTVHFQPVDGVDHFAVLYPMNRLIVGKILLDTDPACNIAFSKEEVEHAVSRGP